MTDKVDLYASRKPEMPNLDLCAFFICNQALIELDIMITLSSRCRILLWYRTCRGPTKLCTTFSDKSISMVVFDAQDRLMVDDPDFKRLDLCYQDYRSTWR
jgi:hypothetical protein